MNIISTHHKDGVYKTKKTELANLDNANPVFL